MKDYYAVLGIVPGVEAVVIKAAYKALIGKYHPDRSVGGEDRAKEINEAYNVVGNASKRAEYDSSFYTDNNWAADKGIFEDLDILDAEAKSAWIIVVEHFPGVVACTRELSLLSANLSSAFQLHLLETKDYENYRTIKKNLENDFLNLYFGCDPEIQQFGLNLLTHKKHSIALELNKRVVVLGPRVNASLIINKIMREHEVAHSSPDWLPPESVLLVDIFGNYVVTSVTGGRSRHKTLEAAAWRQQAAENAARSVRDVALLAALLVFFLLGVATYL